MEVNIATQDGTMPEPCSKKQAMMLSSDADIMVIGGAAGGKV